MGAQEIEQALQRRVRDDRNLDPYVALTTRADVTFLVRPAQPSDAQALAEFFEHVSREDLRFRFLTALQKVGGEMLDMLVSVDHDRTENFLAFTSDEKTIIATAMIAADADRERAEVALAIRSDFKKRGISWTLLEYVANWARDKGIKVLESVESREHHAAIELEREMGFTANEYPGDSTLILLRADLTGNDKG